MMNFAPQLVVGRVLRPKYPKDRVSVGNQLTDKLFYRTGRLPPFETSGIEV
jgi:hypothetical protein